MKNAYWKLGLLGSCLLFGFMAFGDPSPVPSVSGGVLVSLGHVNSIIPSSLSGWVLGLIAFVVELLMRIVPTAQPRSLFILVANFFNLIGSIFTKISVLLDSVVQNLSPPSSS